MAHALPPSVRAAYVGVLVYALVLGCCTLSSVGSLALQAYLVGQIGQENMGLDPELASLETVQRVSIVLVVAQSLTVLALALGGSFGISGMRAGWYATLGALGLVVLMMLVEVGGSVWMWSALGARGGTDAIPVETLLVAMVPSLVWLLIRLALVFGAGAALLSSEARAHYAREGAAPLGPRG